MCLLLPFFMRWTDGSTKNTPNQQQQQEKKRRSVTSISTFYVLQGLWCIDLNRTATTAHKTKNWRCFCFKWLCAACVMPCHIHTTGTQQSKAEEEKTPWQKPKLFIPISLYISTGWWWWLRRVGMVRLYFFSRCFFFCCLLVFMTLLWIFRSGFAAYLC